MRADLQHDAGLHVGAEPCSDTSSRYGPVGRFGTIQAPCAVGDDGRVKPVSVCVAVTVTPGSTAPLSSVTRPVSSAVACAQAMPPDSTGSTQQREIAQTALHHTTLHPQ